MHTPAAAPVVQAAALQGAPTYAARNPGVVRRVQPRVAEGRTELRDSMFVVRSGDGMTVHFDTRDMRTRRAEKFEWIVRSTGAAVSAPGWRRPSLWVSCLGRCGRLPPMSY